MRAAAQTLSQIMNERTDVSALGASDAKSADGLRIRGETVSIDVHHSLLALYFSAFAREFVERHASDLHGRNHGRQLHEVSEKFGRLLVQLLDRQRWHR